MNLESITLSEKKKKRPHTVAFHSCENPEQRDLWRQKVDYCLLRYGKGLAWAGAGGVEGRGVIAEGYSISF